MHCWLFFQRELSPGVPEAAEVYRFMEVARRMDIELDVLQPRDFDLVVDSTEGWSALYNGRKLKKPDVIIPGPEARQVTSRWRCCGTSSGRALPWSIAQQR